jgi:predicted DNA-binding protein
MAGRTKPTRSFNIRPRKDLVERLAELAPKCGLSTANELAVELIEIGVELMEKGELQPEMHERLRRLRLRLHGYGGTESLEELISRKVAEEVATLYGKKPKARGDKSQPAA